MSNAIAASLFISNYTKNSVPLCIHQVNSRSINKSDYSYNDNPLNQTGLKGYSLIPKEDEQNQTTKSFIVSECEQEWWTPITLVYS